MQNNGVDVLETVVAKAHNICNHILLFEAVDMEEDEIRLFLNCNHVSNQNLQNIYLDLVKEYDEMTSGQKTWGSVI
jgi:hypothetical protein